MITLTQRAVRFRQLLGELLKLSNETPLQRAARKLSILEAQSDQTHHLFNSVVLDIAHCCVLIVSSRKGVAYEACLNQMFDIQDKKGRDYGEETDGLKNLRRRGVYGVIARMGDKLTRMETLTQPGREAKVQDESVEDTALDFANYCLLLIILVEDGKGMYEGHSNASSEVSHAVQEKR